MKIILLFILSYAFLLPSSALSNPIDETKHFGLLRTGKSGPKCIVETYTVCLPATTPECNNVEVDLGRSGNNGTSGYNIQLLSGNNPSGQNQISHTLSGRCLVSQVKVCRKRRQRGWYEANHTIFGMCVPKTDDKPIEEAALKPGQVYQHSAKILCGPIKADISQLNSGILAVPGLYVSTVNIHNPTYKDVSFRWKSVPAGRAQDAGHSQFTHGTIAADNAQFFDCGMFSKNPLQPFDGYFVIEADQALDVNTIYSATDKLNEGQIALDVETVRERISEPGTDWKCQKRTSIDLSLAENWFIDDNQTAVLANPIPGRPGALSYKADAGANGGLPAGAYPFELDLCLCGTDEKDSIAQINWNGEQRTDDGLVLIVDRPSPASSNSLVNHPNGVNNQPANLPNPNPTYLTKMGTHTIRATVYNKKSGTPNNLGNLMTFSPKGSITITNGYPGVCLQDR